MAKNGIPANKTQANFALDRDVREAITAESFVKSYVRMDGSLAVRASDVVNDVLRRFLIVEGELPMPPAVRDPRKPTGTTAKKKTTRTTTTRKKTPAKKR